MALTNEEVDCGNNAPSGQTFHPRRASGNEILTLFCWLMPNVALVCRKATHVDDRRVDGCIHGLERFAGARF